MKRIHILENTLRSVLLENRESKNINLARKFLKSHGYDDEQAQRTLDAIRTDMPNARLAQCKFLLGVVRLFLNKELADGNAIMKLNSYLPYIASDAHVNEYDNDLNGMSYDEIAERFRPMYTQDAENSRQESYGKERTVNTEYSIVRIPDFETASKYGDYTKWCVTHDDYAYDAYTSEGRGLFYFCLRKGFERVSKKVGEGCPLDEYGLSMIAVSVTDEGEPNTITCRWNHENGANDHVMSKDDLEDLLGVNFYEAFKPYTEDELLERGLYTVSILRRWISEGKDILDICYYSQIADNLFEIDVCQESSVLYNSHLNKLMPSDDVILQDIKPFYKGYSAIQRKDDKWTFINTEGQQIFDWYKDVRLFEDGVVIVQREDNKWGLLNTEGQQIGDWYMAVKPFINGIVTAQRDDGKWSLINTQSQQIGDWYNNLILFFPRAFKVENIDGKQSLINMDSQRICDWYKNIVFINCELAKVQRNDNMVSLINPHGKRICDWFSPNTNFRIVSPNKIYDNNSNKLIPLYNESCTRLNDLVTEVLHKSIKNYLLYN